MSQFGRTVLLTGVCLWAVCVSPTYAAETRSYFYSDITADITVERNASIVVEERQTYDFTGEYHMGYRSIPHKDIGAITDIDVIEVTDGLSETGASYVPYEHSPETLDKTDPQSWGKYTYYVEDGATNIEWYYNLDSYEHAQRTWIIRYRVHGAVSFYPAHDELYWNVFGGYDVPVRTVQTIVRLPEPITKPSSSLYRLQKDAVVLNRTDEFTYHFITYEVVPNEPVTISVGWQKGIVSPIAFWLDWLKINIPFVLAGLVIIGSIILSFLHWFFTEYFHKGRGTIIPEYEPPRKLPPAMAELICYERVSTKTWPATLVDLAVRGYIKIIKERREPKWAIGFLGTLFVSEGYRVERIRDFHAENSVRLYEKELLDELLHAGSGLFFSTIDHRKRLQGDSSLALSFQHRMEELTKQLYQETEETTKAYEIPLSVMNPTVSFSSLRPAFVIAARILMGIGALIVIDLISLELTGNGYFALIIACIIALVILYRSFFMNPRLSHEGFLLRDDWRGFKLYLQTAEKYRLQNLTPDLFEKYLPYAMIFGIEKKWAKAFESMHLQTPQWYGTTGYAPGSSPTFASGGSGSFSSSVFSSSFATSFSSTFSSSGAGGASGGGGGAGGGGGGGGGGAS